MTLLFVALCSALNSIQFSHDFIVLKTIDTPYRKVAWNMLMIEKHPERFQGSTIFLGSSLVQGAVNDSLLSQNGMKYINLAVPHNGNELNLYFLEKVVELKPEKVIWLKGKVPYSGLHKLTPLIYTPSELLSRGQTFNSSFVRYFFKRTKLSMQYLGFLLLDGKLELTKNQQTFLGKVYGYISAPGQLSQKVFNDYTDGKISRNDEYYNLYLNNYKYTSEQGKSGLGQLFKFWKRKLVQEKYLKSNFIRNVKCQENFILQAKGLMDINGIKFQKMYIPLLIDVLNYDGVDYQRSYYQSTSSDTSDVLYFMNYTFLSRVNYWSDVDHLSKEGATHFTNKLSFQLAK